MSVKNSALVYFIDCTISEINNAVDVESFSNVSFENCVLIGMYGANIASSAIALFDNCTTGSLNIAGQADINNCKIDNNSGGSQIGINILGTARITNTSISNNTWFKGVNIGGRADLINCRINNNVVQENGSKGVGIYISGVGNLVKCDISKNRIIQAHSGEGAGIYVAQHAFVNIDNSTINDNENLIDFPVDLIISSGGGLNIAGSAKINNSKINNNKVVVSGGGIFVSGNLELNHCEIIGNSTFPEVGIGTGVYATGSLSIKNSIIASNTTQNNTGNGISASESSDVLIDNVTVSGHSSSGLYLKGCSYVVNSLIYENGVGVQFFDSYNIYNPNPSNIAKFFKLANCSLFNNLNAGVISSGNGNMEYNVINGNGNGIRLYEGSVNITGNSINDNYNDGVKYLPASPETLYPHHKVCFINNTIGGNKGRGINLNALGTYEEYIVTWDVYADISNCTIANNENGGIVNCGTNIRIKNSIIAGNVFSNTTTSIYDPYSTTTIPTENIGPSPYDVHNNVTCAVGTIVSGGHNRIGLSKYAYFTENTDKNLIGFADILGMPITHDYIKRPWNEEPSTLYYLLNTAALNDVTALDKVPTINSIDWDNRTINNDQRGGIERPQGILCDIGAIEMRTAEQHYMTTSTSIPEIFICPEPASTTTISSATTSTIINISTTTTISIDNKCPAKKVLGANNSQLENLRKFRETTMAKTTIGRKLIEIYYNNADSINTTLDKSPALQAFTRIILEMIASMVGRKEY